MHVVLNLMVSRTEVHACSNYGVFNEMFLFSVGVEKVQPQVYFIPGFDVTLISTSELFGNPTPNFTCRAQSNIYIMEGEIYTSTNGRVVIANPESADAGIYSCIASNEIGSDINVTLNLTKAGIAHQS